MTTRGCLAASPRISSFDGTCMLLFHSRQCSRATFQTPLFLIQVMTRKETIFNYSGLYCFGDVIDIGIDSVSGIPRSWSVWSSPTPSGIPCSWSVWSSATPSRILYDRILFRLSACENHNKRQSYGIPWKIWTTSVKNKTTYTVWARCKGGD